MRQRLLEALGRMIVREGVAAVGVNALARDVRVMNGVKIETEADWERIYAATDALIDGALEGA
jgi:hypothetical protein